MKDQLKRLFSESTSFQQHSPTTPQSFTSVPKIEDINFTDNMNYFPDESSVLYTANRNFRGRFNTSSFRGNTRANSRSHHYPPRAPTRGARSNINPLNEHGKLTTCTICSSVMHWAPTCPHRSSSTYISTHDTEQQSHIPGDWDKVQEYFEHITLFQYDLDSQQNMIFLMAESLNCALIDCGASKTVCGNSWFEIFYDSLPEDQQQSIVRVPSSRNFRFGDGQNYVSMGQVIFSSLYRQCKAYHYS